MKILIVEDEIPAVKILKRILSEVPELESEIVGVTESVSETIGWLQKNPVPELIFMDIHLTDGLSFDILNVMKVECPIIFTTAYDQYAIDAFKHNSIDYILKPYNVKDVERAVTKLKMLTSIQLDDYLQCLDKNVRKHFVGSFLITSSDKLLILNTVDVAYFYTTNEQTIACTYDGTQYDLDRSLESISESLNPQDFIRANRQFVISRKSIKDIDFWFGSRLSVNLIVRIPERIVVSKLKTARFKEWLANS